MSTIHAAGAEPTGSPRPETTQPDPVDGIARDLDRIRSHFPGSLTVAVQRELTSARVHSRSRDVLAAVLTILDGACVPADRSRAILGSLLAEMTGIRPGHIYRHANELAEARFLKVERRKRRPTLYRRGDRLLNLTRPGTTLAKPVAAHVDAPRRRDKAGPPHHGGASPGPPPDEMRRGRRAMVEVLSRLLGGPNRSRDSDSAQCSKPARFGRGAPSPNGAIARGDPPPCVDCGEPVPWHRNQARWFERCEACYRKRRDSRTAIAQPLAAPTNSDARKPLPEFDPAKQAFVLEQLARLRAITDRAGANPGPTAAAVTAPNSRAG